MLSVPDMAILGILALLVFGEQKLPGIMRQAGRIMREVQSTSQSFVREMERAADVSEPAPPKPAPTPMPAYDEMHVIDEEPEAKAAPAPPAHAEPIPPRHPERVEGRPEPAEGSGPPA